MTLLLYFCFIHERKPHYNTGHLRRIKEYVTEQKLLRVIVFKTSYYMTVQRVACNTARIDRFSRLTTAIKRRNAKAARSE